MRPSIIMPIMGGMVPPPIMPPLPPIMPPPMPPPIPPPMPPPIAAAHAAAHSAAHSAAHAAHHAAHLAGGGLSGSCRGEDDAELLAGLVGDGDVDAAVVAALGADGDLALAEGLKQADRREVVGGLDLRRGGGRLSWPLSRRPACSAPAWSLFSRATAHGGTSEATSPTAIAKDVARNKIRITVCLSQTNLGRKMYCIRLEGRSLRT